MQHPHDLIECSVGKRTEAFVNEEGVKVDPTVFRAHHFRQGEGQGDRHIERFPSRERANGALDRFGAGVVNNSQPETGFRLVTAFLLFVRSDEFKTPERNISELLISDIHYLFETVLQHEGFQGHFRDRFGTCGS